MSGIAGIVLCGGESKRMGRAKADLPFGSETLLQRVVRILQQVVDQVVVVHAVDQVLPQFGQPVTSIADPIPFGGPLVGLLAGLNAIADLPDEYSAAYLTSCDTPFLEPRFVREIFDQLADHDVAVPFDDKYFFPLAAVYRPSLRYKAAELVKLGTRRPRELFDHCSTRRLETQSLTHVDPKLQSLVNLNSPQDYKDALQSENLPLPAWLDEL